jgi:hypothetical protein
MSNKAAAPPLLSEGPYDYGLDDSPDGATAEFLERKQAEWLARVQSALHAHFPAVPAAELGEESLGAYIISMCQEASDVLLVEVLLEELLMPALSHLFESTKAT